MDAIKPLFLGPFTVLIVEDDADTQEMHRECLRDCCRVLSALTTTVAEELFNQFRDSIRIVVMDGTVPGSCSTTDLVKKFRKESPCCFILAATGSLDRMNQLIDAGCDTGTIRKDTVWSVASRLAKMMQEPPS